MMDLMTKECPKCKTKNPDSSGFCQECGTELAGARTNTNSKEVSGGITGFWNKQAKGGKVAIGIGVCCLGIILILAIVGMTTPDKNSNNTTSTTQNTSAPTTSTVAATTYTISKLYSNPPATGTNIKVSGEVVQSGDGFIRLENSALKDIYVLVSGTPSVYEDQNATVEGTYTGPYQYDTAMGSTRTVPGMDGKIV
jgi:hypothetical protein